MFSLLGRVVVTAGTRAAKAWPAALSLVIYAVILFAAAMLVAPLGGLIGGLILGFVAAACWSSYLTLISQAVVGSKIRLDWSDFKKTFGAHLWDVVSVMFAFWIIGLLTRPLLAGPNGPAMAAILAIATAFFFNVVPELLYQGRSRSFALLMDSARFMLAHPVVWLLPNLLFAAVALGVTGQLDVEHPAELLLVFGRFFSSPASAGLLFAKLPIFAWPVVLAAIHYLMVFRGILFAELEAGVDNPRLRAFRAQMRR
jgi:hypothetical protein